MPRLSLAFRSFFGVLSEGKLPEEIATESGYVRAEEQPVEETKAPPPPAAPSSADGALQMLALLQRDARLVDFVMEDISGATDDQVGAAVRMLHQQCRETLTRYVTLAPVIDGVENTVVRVDSRLAADPSSLKLLGNVPPNGKAASGVLKHRGWRADKVELPTLSSAQDLRVVAPAEVEIE